MTAQISAKIIEHSVSEDNHELISIQTYAPYFLDAELEKHGMLASNSSSNRAIPFKKVVEAEYYLPPDLRKNQKGMQGFEHLSEDEVKLVHEELSKVKIFTNDKLLEIERDFNLHKQHLNRYLTGFTMQNKIMTANRYWWEKMLELRDHPDADPNVQILAKHIDEVITLANSPRELNYGDWHLPYVKEEERNSMELPHLLITSTARCARTSYNLLGEDKPSTLEKDLELHDFLAFATPPHETPLEHQATPIPYETIKNIWNPDYWPRGVTHIKRNGTMGSGRLDNYIMYRHYNDRKR